MGNPGLQAGEEVIGTVKLHGTNAAFAYHDEELWFQSRTNIINPIKDNAGFAASFSSTDKIDAIKSTIKNIKEVHQISDDKIIVMFGEWCGGSIQKGMALNQLGKRFVLFAIRVVNKERSNDGNHTYDRWLPIAGISIPEMGIYNIEDYSRYELLINLNNPAAPLKEIEKLVAEVEAECPFSKSFGAIGLGEGIVWTLTHKNIRYVFKTKGEKHSNVRQRKPATIDPEKLASVLEFVDYTVTENRLKQAIEQVFSSQSIEPTVKGTGYFLKWLVNDIVSEEIDTLSENGLCAKDVNSSISKKGRLWFFSYLDKEAYK